MKTPSSYRTTMVWWVVAGSILLAIGGTVRADFTFGEPVNLGANVNSAFNDGGLTISSDGLSLFFNSNRSGSNWDIWQCTRDTTEDEWGPATNLGSRVNSPQNEGYPSVSTDGLELFFCSIYWLAVRPGGLGGGDLWVAKKVPVTGRFSISYAWGEPENLGSLVNSASHESDPYISADGLELYFSSDRPGGEGDFDLYVATRPTKNDAWDAPVNLGPVVNSPSYEYLPCISSDGLALFFQGSRPGGYGRTDVYITTRATTSDPWGEPVNLGPLVNDAAGQEPYYISPDGSTLYLNTGASLFGKADLWQVPIIPIVDLNGDLVVDAADMCIMVVDCWGTADPLCDIGPMPWGDGIVDVQDLIVLAGHLFEEVVPRTPPTSFGSFTEDPPGTYTMTDRGADIWDAEDQFHFAYKTFTGPGSIVARLDSLTNTDPWAKAGVMIRETLDCGSKHAFVCVTPSNGVAFEGRMDTDGTSFNTNQTGITAPHWVKLERDSAGNFTASHSHDGLTWLSIAGAFATNIPMNTDVHIGLALTSHNTLETCQAVFSNVTITGDVIPQWSNQDVSPLGQP